ncbi:MAG: hypothetical protein ACOC80_15150 [Petrotogales bacterium]
MANYPNEVSPGQFISTTQIYDLGKNGTNSEDFITRLRQNLNNIVIALNAKESGYYSQEETINGQLFYPDYSRINSYDSAPQSYRQIFRKVIDFGRIPDVAGSPKQISHDINFLPTTGNTTFIATRIYGTTTNQTDRIMLPIPYYNIGGDIIDLRITSTDIEISCNSNAYTAFTKTSIILEYIKF